MITEYAIGLGSNLDDRLDNLRRAHAMLNQCSGRRLTEAAPVYETRPVDVPGEYAGQLFLNSVVIVCSTATPEQILDAIKDIERDLGRIRKRAVRNGPRTIDLDILYAGNAVIDQPGLIVPHPRWMQRAFVARPLADLRPDLVLPGSKLTVRQVLATLNTEGVVRIANCPWW